MLCDDAFFLIKGVAPVPMRTLCSAVSCSQVMSSGYEKWGTCTCVYAVSCCVMLRDDHAPSIIKGEPPVYVSMLSCAVVTLYMPLAGVMLAFTCSAL